MLNKSCRLMVLPEVPRPDSVAVSGEGGGDSDAEVEEEDDDPIDASWHCKRALLRRLLRQVEHLRSAPAALSEREPLLLLLLLLLLRLPLRP